MISVHIIKEGRPNTLAVLGQRQKEIDEPEFRKRDWMKSIKKYIIAEMGVMKEIEKWQDILANSALEDDADPTIIEQFQQHVAALKKLRAYIQKETKDLQANKNKLDSFKQKRVLFSPQYIMTQSRYAYEEEALWGRDLAEDHLRKMMNILNQADKTPNL